MPPHHDPSSTGVTPRLPLAVLVAATAAAVAFARPPADGGVWGFIAASGMAAAALAWCLRSWNPKGGQVLLLAVGLRLLALPMMPSLSDDGYRYLWDGAMTADGRNPYGATPREALEEGFEPPVPLRLLNSPDYASVYPPVSQALFALAMGLGKTFEGGWWVWKLLLLSIEVGGLAVLLRWVRPQHLALYAWHPVTVIEIAGQGHTEGLAIGFLSAMLAALLGHRPWRAGVALAFAGWVKLWPFALAALVRRRRVRTWAAVVLSSLVLALPWAAGVDAEGVRQSLALYGGTFDFYSAPYTVVKSILWPFVGETSGRVAAGALGIGSLLALSVIALSIRRIPRRVSLGVLTVTLVSTTLHPWHLLPALWAVANGKGEGRRAVYWLVSIAPLTYSAYAVPGLMPVALFIGWGGALGLLLWGRYGSRWIDTILQRRGERKWARIRNVAALASPTSVLDYGCAEGYVGLAAARDGHMVHLADLSDQRQCDLPFTRVSERMARLPADAFDLVALVFVLHHAESPTDVIQNAMRSARGRIVIWETVPAPWMPKPLLHFVDQQTNALRHGRMSPAHLRYVEEWESLFERLGLRVLRRERWGIGHPQALWLLERSNGGLHARVGR